MIKKLLIAPILIALPVAVQAENVEYKPGDMTKQQQRLSSEQKAEMQRKKQDAVRKKKEQLQAKTAEKTEQRRLERCDKAKQALAGRAEKVGARKQVMSQNYTTVETRWQRLIDRAEKEGVDASKLEQALVQFKQYHEQFKTDMEALRALQSSHQRACNDEEGSTQFKTELREVHTKVLQSAKQLRTFRQDTQKNVIVPLLKDLAQAIEDKIEGSNR